MITRIAAAVMVCALVGCHESSTPTATTPNDDREFAAMCRLLGLGVMQLSSGGHATGNEYFAAPGNATLSDSQSSQE